MSAIAMFVSIIHLTPGKFLSHILILTFFRAFPGFAPFLQFGVIINSSSNQGAFSISVPYGVILSKAKDPARWEPVEHSSLCPPIENEAPGSCKPIPKHVLKKERFVIKVNGIGGVFLYANDPKTLAEWYTLHFGLDFLSDSANTYYMEFYYRDDTDSSRRWSTVFAIMPAKHPLSSQRGEYMINYRVDDLRGFLEHLHAGGVLTGPFEEQDDGRYPGSKGLFSWITDPEGNHLELYQPL